MLDTYDNNPAHIHPCNVHNDFSQVRNVKKIEMECSV